MEIIGHFTLKISTGILQTERKLFVGKSAPRTDKGCLMLISRRDINLVVSRKTIHEGIHFAPRTLVNELINKRGGEVILWTGLVNVTIINTDSNSTLLFSHREDIRHPVRERNGIDETSLEKLFDFCFDSGSLSGVHGA